LSRVLSTILPEPAGPFTGKTLSWAEIGQNADEAATIISVAKRLQ